MARWFALGIDKKPLGPEFHAPDLVSAEYAAPVLHGSRVWKVISVMQYEDDQRIAEAEARAAARKLKWSPV